MSRNGATDHSQPRGAADLLADLRSSVGVREGQTWIVHASMRSLGYIVGGPEAVIDAFRHAVGSAGTLLMPAFSDPSPDGRFDLARTPSRVGLISETFRTLPGVIRSRHPTHSIAGHGPAAAALLANHDRTAPLGIDSPLDRAARAGAYVLMIGCGLTAASVIHVAESRVRVPYLGRAAYPGYDRPIICRDAAGHEWTYRPRDTPGDSSRFGLLEAPLRAAGQFQDVRLGDAHCLRFAAADAVRHAVDLLRSDPIALLCRDERCGYCPGAWRAVWAEAAASRRAATPAPRAAPPPIRALA